MKKNLLIIVLFALYGTGYGALAGGRPNAFSEGDNAFAGVINPANAVWITDRFDIGAFLVRQKSALINKDNNPFFPPGKIDLTYKSKSLFTADAAIHKQMKLEFGCRDFDISFSLAAYTMPTLIKLRTKKAFPIAGTTPIIIRNKIDVITAVFSLKLNACHSIGVAVDYFYFSHLREGFQNSDNPERSVSPGHVTNNGMDHSWGIGCSIGWRWKVTEALSFGIAGSKKNYCGQYRKYRGFEPHHAKNFTPDTVGAGISYRFTPKIAARLEVLWLNLGNLPGANNNILPNGELNLHKRGSKKSPGPGLQDATFISVGIGYKFNSHLSVGVSFSHRIKLHSKHHNIISHTYRLQTIYNVLSFGANLVCEKHILFLGLSYGFKNRVSGFMPLQIGGGRFVGEKQDTSLSISWGYLL